MITTLNDYVKSDTVQKPLPVYLLWFSLIMLSVIGLVNGTDLILNPSVREGNISIEVFKSIPLVSSLVPGIILFVCIGICPWFILYGLMNRWQWKFARRINLYTDQYWAWTNAFYYGIGMILTNDLLFMYLGSKHVLQNVFALYGLLIVIVTLLPGVKKYYSVTRA